MTSLRMEKMQTASYGLPKNERTLKKGDKISIRLHAMAALQRLLNHLITNIYL